MFLSLVKFRSQCQMIFPKRFRSQSGVQNKKTFSDKKSISVACGESQFWLSKAINGRSPEGAVCQQHCKLTVALIAAVAVS